MSHQVELSKPGCGESSSGAVKARVCCHQVELSKPWCVVIKWSCQSQGVLSLSGAVKARVCCHQVELSKPGCGESSSGAVKARVW